MQEASTAKNLIWLQTAETSKQTGITIYHHLQSLYGDQQTAVVRHIHCNIRTFSYSMCLPLQVT